MSRMLFLYNPRSGKGQTKTHLSDIIDTFTKAGYDVTVRPTQEQHDAYNYIAAQGSEYDRIVVSGGDGTLNEATRALMTFDAGERRELGYIPSGTTNDFGTTLGIPKNMIEAAKIAGEGEPFKCDAGSFNGNVFNYIAAFGAFTDVSYDTPQGTKNVMGHMAYVLEGIKRIPSIPSYDVKIKYDSGEIEETVFLCFIMNATSIGGVLNTDRLINVDLQDGEFEMLVFRQPTNVFELQAALAGIVTGQSSGTGYTLVRSSHFEITSRENIKWTLDGEYGGETQKAVIDVLPAAITYIVNSNMERMLTSG